MHFAASSTETLRIFELLVEAGGDLTVRDNQGKTPLQVFGRKKENPEVYEYLKQIQAKQKTGPRPLLEKRQVPSKGADDTGPHLNRLKSMFGGNWSGRG